MKHTKNINGAVSVEICSVRKRQEVDMYEATIFAAGAFGGGTITIQASPDGGTTKVNLRDISGSVVAITQDDAYNVRLGFADKLGEEIKLYATMAGGAAQDVDVTVFDNV